MFSVALGAMFEVLSPTAFFLEIGCRLFEIQALGRGGVSNAAEAAERAVAHPWTPHRPQDKGEKGSAGRHSMPLVHQVIDCGDAGM